MPRSLLHYFTSVTYVIFYVVFGGLQLLGDLRTLEAPTGHKL